MEKYIRYTGFCIFTLFAGLQYNDPDPFIWMSIYGGTALISLHYFRKFDQLIFFMLGYIFAIGMKTLMELFPISELNSHEPIYEILGLLICSIWLFYLKNKNNNDMK